MTLNCLTVELLSSRALSTAYRSCYTLTMNNFFTQRVSLLRNADPQLLKAAVYGANDGIITTFAVVAGVAGAKLPPSIVLILGIANMIADGLSMGVGDFLGERSEQKMREQQTGEVVGRDIWKTGLITFIGFVIAGTFPLLPYLIGFMGMPLESSILFPLSIIATVIVQFLVGVFRSIFTLEEWWRSGLEMVALGAIAAIVAFVLGAGVEQIVR